MNILPVNRKFLTPSANQPQRSLATPSDNNPVPHTSAITAFKLTFSRLSDFTRCYELQTTLGTKSLHSYQSLVATLGTHAKVGLGLAADTPIIPKSKIAN